MKLLTGATSLVLVSLCGCRAHQTTMPMQTGPTHNELSGEEVDRILDDIDALLDGFHQAASKADEETYFNSFTPSGVFIGTDSSELWDLEEFRAFAMPYFQGESAWTYEPFQRRVTLAASGDHAWFYEKLSNESYGEARGSGAIEQYQGEWRIAQYVLSFPIPNEIAGKLLPFDAPD